jgi:ParB-like nuclease domain.
MVNGLFLSFDGDAIGRKIGKARLSNDVDEVRRLDQAIGRGNEVFKSFALAAGGNIVEIGGDEGLLQVPATALNNLDQARKNYESAVGATVSVGIGKEIGDSSKALMVAKLRGRNQSVFYDEEVEKEYQEGVKDPKSEQEKLRDEYLSKAVPEAGDGLRAEGSGGQGKQVPGASAPHRQLRDSNENKEVEEIADYSPPVIEGSGMTAQFQDQFQSQADKSEQEERVKEVRKSGLLKELKQKTAQSLESLRQQLPVISQLKTSYPDTYQSILGLVQSVIGLGRGLQEIDTNLAKSEGQRKRNWVGGGLSIPPLGTLQRENWEKNFKSALAGYFSNGDIEALKPTTVNLSDLDQPHLVDESHPRVSLYTRMQIGRDRVPPILVSKLENGKYHVLDGNHRVTAARMAGAGSLPAYERIPSLTKDMLQTSEPVSTYDLGLFKAGLSEGNRLEDYDPDQLAIGTQKEMSEHQVEFEIAQDIAADHLTEDPEYYSKEDSASKTWNDGVSMETRKEELEPDEAPPKNSKVLDKKGLEKIGLEGTLPVGTLKDGKIKVRHYDGNSGWVGVKAGMIQGQDPSRHPVSSLRPGAR